MAQSPPVGKLKRFVAGQLLIRENEVSRKLFIIQSGKVSVFKTHMGQKVVLSTLAEGEIFGELSFIEATPRSASVEALTAVDVHIIEIDDVNAQLEKVPEWILPIFKTVFSRLREADQRIVATHGLSTFERKHFGKDGFTQKTYHELLRFNKLLKMAHAESKEEGRALGEEAFLVLVTEIIGDLAFNPSLLMKVLKDQGFIDADEYEKRKRIVLRSAAHSAWIQDLQYEVSTERYLHLGDAGLGVLRELHRYLSTRRGVALDSEAELEISLTDVGPKFIAFGDQAIDELANAGLLRWAQQGRFRIVPAVLNRVYSNQIIIRFMTPGQWVKVS